MRAKQILITGGDGYIGMRLAHAYLELTDMPVLLWVRAGTLEEFHSKRERLQQKFGRYESRIAYEWGDLVRDHPFDAVDPRRIRMIIHTAAGTRFNVDEDTAQRVNIDGPEKLLKFGRRCDSLEAFGLLSPVYSSGLKPGVVADVPFEHAGGFAKPDENTKSASVQTRM